MRLDVSPTSVTSAMVFSIVFECSSKLSAGVAFALLLARLRISSLSSVHFARSVQRAVQALIDLVHGPDVFFDVEAFGIHARLE